MSSLVNSTMKEAQPVDELGASCSTLESRPTSLHEPSQTSSRSAAWRAGADRARACCRVEFTRSTVASPASGSAWTRTARASRPHERGGPAGKLLQPAARHVRLRRARAGALHVPKLRHGLRAGLHQQRQRPGLPMARARRRVPNARGSVDENSPLDLLLERPVFTERGEPAEYDFVTGRLEPAEARDAANRRSTSGPTDSGPSTKTMNRRDAKPGEFRPCAVCGESATFGRSSVQDHQTKGDQPFQALIAKQIQVQPPSPCRRRGSRRCGPKGPHISDSRQTAARLAPNLQTYSTQDAIRPLIVAGYARLARNAAIATYSVARRPIPWRTHRGEGHGR